MELTVLYDAGCPWCARFRDWLVDHRQSLREITVIGSDGSVWTTEHAWVMCWWATRTHRPLAERLARPAWPPLARGAAATAAGIRHLMAAAGGDYPDRCAGSCPPPVAVHQG